MATSEDTNRAPGRTGHRLVFEDKAALDAYQDHPDHMAVKAKVKPMCFSRTVLDYAA